jgi:hypothetical protein
MLLCVSDPRSYSLINLYYWKIITFGEFQSLDSRATLMWDSNFYNPEPKYRPRARFIFHYIQCSLSNIYDNIFIGVYSFIKPISGLTNWSASLRSLKISIVRHFINGPLLYSFTYWTFF